MEVNGSNYSMYRPWTFKRETGSFDVAFKLETEQKYIIFDRRWYNTELLPEIRQEILIKCQEYDYIVDIHDITIPHEERELADIDLIIYKIYISQYDMSKYFTYLNRPIVLIPITYPGLRQTLIDIAKTRILCNRPFTDRDLQTINDDYPDFINHLRNGIKSLAGPANDSIFFKTSRTSGKNDLACQIQECLTYRDVLDRLTNNQLFYRDLIRPEITFQLVLQAWVEIKYEFRVFIYDYQVIAVAQQRWFEKIRYKVHPMTLINQIIQTKFNLPFPCAVLDVGFITTDDNEDNELKLYLIECNPYGAWACSGSSMFTWAEVLANQPNEDESSKFCNDSSIKEPLIRYSAIL